MSGVKFGLVDVDRVIKNMAIVQVDNDYELAFHERSIGAIEDMLDARFKMYRWFYSHHTVVMTNELIRLAIEKLVEEDEAIAKLFHWSAFEDGLSTDENILLQLRKRVNLSEYHSFRGILDRRYLPVSLFKSTPDFGRFMADIVNRAKRKESLHVVREKIINFFNKEEAGATLKSRLESTGGELSNCVILNTDVVMKPYEPFSESEKVYLYRTGESQLCELSSESEYFRAVNEAWKHYHGLYVFYLIPGQKKEKFAQYKNIVIDIFAEEIAKTY
jgi:HD superfamily phosphohydrolase